jgi:hypothetical protein
MARTKYGWLENVRSCQIHGCTACLTQCERTPAKHNGQNRSHAQCGAPRRGLVLHACQPEPFPSLTLAAVPYLSGSSCPIPQQPSTCDLGWMPLQDPPWTTCKFSAPGCRTVPQTAVSANTFPGFCSLPVFARNRAAVHRLLSKYGESFHDHLLVNIGIVLRITSRLSGHRFWLFFMAIR